MPVHYPVNCLKVLGTSSGILYPPDKLHPNKRFVLSQDVLEMMLRSCVGADEVLNGKEIRERLWDRFGIIIGGSQFELDKIRQSGMIMQVDEDALEANFTSFASALESMDFAEEMADGILQIRLGGLSND
jgi:aspartate aminotransferase-like enzyme